MRAFNFSSGPAVMPEEVLLELREELPEYGSSGTTVLEMSHRSAEYTVIADSARASMRRLLGLGDEWHVLFLSGGASLQFYQVPLNLLPPSGRAGYALTGWWAQLALAEAKRVGDAYVVASSAESNYDHIPDPASWQISPGTAYVHFTSNNTIYGTQFHQEPDTGGIPLVCDASSDLLSRPINLDRYGLIYAGAQKNLGPAGTTLVLVRDSLVQTRNPNLPTMLDYGTHTASLFNTPPVVSIYLVEKVLRWIERQGGLKAMEAHNRAKAELLYERIDRTDFYRGTCRTSDRSWMNVCFRLRDPSLESRFVNDATTAGLRELKGHRSVGGVRASIYNAMPLEGVRALVAFMDHFEATNG
jgi:phosphoserine aminotransferase